LKCPPDYLIFLVYFTRDLIEIWVAAAV